MSSQFRDYVDSIPEPLINEWYNENIDLEGDGVEWKRIEGYPDYFVSRYGYVGSIRSGKFIILRTWHNTYGHHYVQLTAPDGTKKKFLVHRLVAEAFCPKTRGCQIVRHLDDDPDNNDNHNLAWGTPKDNHDDCVKHGRDFKRAVYCYELDKIFKSCADAADYFEVSKSAITVCCKGGIHAIHGEFHLCYADDIEMKKSNVDKWTWKGGCRKRVRAINLETGEERVYRSRQEASADLHIPDSYISNIIAGRKPQSTRGWTFKDEEGKYA